MALKTDGVSQFMTNSMLQVIGIHHIVADINFGIFITAIGVWNFDFKSIIWYSGWISVIIELGTRNIN